MWEKHNDKNKDFSVLNLRKEHVISSTLSFEKYKLFILKAKFFYTCKLFSLLLLNASFTVKV